VEALLMNVVVLVFVIVLLEIAALIIFWPYLL
jgi:hypothetical protein